MKNLIFAFTLLLSFQCLAQGLAEGESCHPNTKKQLLGRQHNKNAADCIAEVKATRSIGFNADEGVEFGTSFCEYQYNTNWTPGQVRQILGRTAFAKSPDLEGAVFFIKAAFLLYNVDYLLEKKIMSFEELAFQTFEYLNAATAIFPYNTDEKLKKINNDVNEFNSWSFYSSLSYYLKVYAIKTFVIGCNGTLEPFVHTTELVKPATWLETGKIKPETAISLISFYDTFSFCAKFNTACERHLSGLGGHFSDEEVQRARAILGILNASNTTFNPYAQVLSQGYPFPDDLTYRKNSQF